mmetsp:Transcript_112935/g.207366  ORF Transcript_112935/g.207366 Transcript_112935/m.207366 type:complete len:431 (+) Transcript_112935:40-1332(+)
MFHTGACLYLCIVLLAVSLTLSQSGPPEVDLHDGVVFCDEASEVCDGSASREDSDDPSDWLGPHLLQTEMHVHKKLGRDVKEAKPVGAKMPKSMAGRPEMHPFLPTWMSGGAHFAFSYAHGLQGRQSALWMLFGMAILLVCMVGVRACYDLATLGCMAYHKPRKSMKLPKCENDALVKLTTDAMDAAKMGMLPVPELTPECTTISSDVQPFKPCTAEIAIKSPSPEMAPENEFATDACKVPGLNWDGARFVLPPKCFDKLGSGNWFATGMSGKNFLRASISDEPENGCCTLVLSSCKTTDTDFVQKWKFTKSPLTGVLPISGSQGEPYGTLEPVPGGRCLVKRDSNVVMSLEIDNHAELQAKASSSAGRQIAASFKNSQEGKAPESGETWKVQVKQGTDAVFVAGCMLAHMLLGAGVSSGALAFPRQNDE